MFSTSGLPRLSPEADNAVASRQLMLATLPLFLVLLYFLLAAALRPYKSIYHIPNNVNDDAYINRIIQKTGRLIPLYHMLLVFLTLTAFWCGMALNILYFVPKRRDLLLQYQVDGQTVIGDVYYEPTSNWFLRRFRDFGYVVYPHPTRQQLWVQKKVRVFQHYTRERIAILVLPNRPLSGQPKTDLEIDVAASAENTNRIKDWGRFFLCWAVFCYLSCFFLLIQMGRINDSYDKEEKGWITFVMASLIVIPGVAIGGNYLRWWMHSQWMTKWGAVVEDHHNLVTSKDDLKQVLSTRHPDEMNDDDNVSHNNHPRQQNRSHPNVIHTSQQEYDGEDYLSQQGVADEHHRDAESSFSSYPSALMDTYTMSDFRSPRSSVVSSP